MKLSEILKAGKARVPLITQYFEKIRASFSNLKKKISAYFKKFKVSFLNLKKKVFSYFKIKIILFLKVFLKIFLLPLMSYNEFTPPIEEKKSVLKTIVFKVIGQIYFWYQQIREWMRITIFNLALSFENLQILWEFIKHSRKLLIWLVILFGLTLLAHFRSDLLSSAYDNKTISNFSLNFFLGLISVLGIILAFYAVGFQVATSKYSSEVTDFINQEEVGRFFFRLLVFAGLFSLAVFMFQALTETLLVVPFLMAIFLTVVSLLGLLIYKDDYITKLKPLSIFRLIFEQAGKSLRLVNEFDSPQIKDFHLSRNKNLRSFRLYFEIRDSWSLYYHLQKRLRHNIRLIGIFIKDLVKESSLDDATFGIRLFGYLFVHYSHIKPYIDRDYGRWFPSVQEPVKAGDGLLYAIKANYEAKGLGVFFKTKGDYDWVEKEIINQIQLIQKNPELMKSPEAVNALIDCYETILAGQFEETKLGNEKLTRGLYELQDFPHFEKILELFFELSDKLPDNESCKANYLNCFGQIKTVIVDGFSLRTFPGITEDWREKVTQAVEELYKNQSTKKIKQRLIDMDLPGITFTSLVDYAEQLEVEKRVEGKIITPQDWLKKRTIHLLEKKEKEVKRKYINKCIGLLLELVEKNPDTYLKNNLSIVILQLFNQLIYNRDWDDLSEIIKGDGIRMLSYFAKIAPDKFESLELGEPIQYGMYNSLVFRKKDLFDFYLKLFTREQIYLHIKFHKNKDISQLLTVVRKLLILGSFAYVISELDGDFYFVKEVTKKIAVFYPSGDFTEALDVAHELRGKLGFDTTFSLIHDEETRYRGFFTKIMDELRRMPLEMFDGDFSFIGNRREGRHPSVFIRRIGSQNLDFIFDIDMCVEGYLKWLKKRKLIKRMISILNYKSK